jgi:hypothetical protein
MPATRATGVAQLRELFEGRLLDESGHALVTLELADALRAEGRTHEAAQLLLDFTRTQPSHLEAARGRELAAELSLAAYRDRWRDTESRAVLDECLEELLRESSATTAKDRWTLIAAELAIEDREPERALQRLGEITEVSEFWLEAQVQRVRAARLAAVLPDGRADAPRMEDVLREAARVQAIIDDRLAGATDARPRAALNLARLRLELVTAEALTALGRTDDAGKRLDALDRSEPLPAELRGEALQIRLEVSRVSGQAGDVRRDLERYLASTAAADAPSVLISLLESANRRVIRLQDEDRLEAAANLARAEAAPLAAIIDEWLRGSTAPMPPPTRLRQLIADAFRLSEQWSPSLSRYDDLLKEHPDQLDLLFGRAECLYGLGPERSAEAMTIFKRLSAARREAADAYYWQSQLRMLQILDRMSEGTEQIAGQVARLKQQDPALGGPRFARQFNALLMKHQP